MRGRVFTIPDRADYVAYQELGDRFPDILKTFASAIQLMLPDGHVFSGGHAVFRLLAL